MLEKEEGGEAQQNRGSAGDRTFRSGWAYLGGGDGDGEIVLRSMSDGLRAGTNTDNA